MQKAPFHSCTLHTQMEMKLGASSSRICEHDVVRPEEATTLLQELQLFCAKAGHVTSPTYLCFSLMKGCLFLLQ